MSGELFYSGQRLSLYIMHSSIVMYGTKKVYAVQVYGTSKNGGGQTIRSGTSNNPLSERRVTSLQQTNSMPMIALPIK